MSRYKAPYRCNSSARSNRITCDSLGTDGKHERQVNAEFKHSLKLEEMCSICYEQTPLLLNWFDPQCTRDGILYFYNFIFYEVKERL